MNKTSITIRKPDDFHVHFRQGSALPAYVRASAVWCQRALVMPNTTPAIVTVGDALRYKQEILQSIAHDDFHPLVTCKLYAHHTADDIRQMKGAGIIACKLYPQGVTTNAEDGIADAMQLQDVYREMAAQDMVLCIHGENPHSFVLDREKDFLDTLAVIQRIAPSLRIVLEHVSSMEAVEYVKNDRSGLLAATVTVHHLLFTLHDMLADFLNPHLFCKPIVKCQRDRDALQSVVLEGHERFFLGTDSAPHDLRDKECAAGCAGVYSAPVALPLLADFFYTKRGDLLSSHTWISALENFTSVYGAQFYKLPRNTATITLINQAWTVPKIQDGVVPLCAGDEMVWSIAL